MFHTCIVRDIVNIFLSLFSGHDRASGPRAKNAHGLETRKFDGLETTNCTPSNDRKSLRLRPFAGQPRQRAFFARESGARLWLIRLRAVGRGVHRRMRLVYICRKNVPVYQMGLAKAVIIMSIMEPTL